MTNLQVHSCWLGNVFGGSPSHHFECFFFLGTRSTTRARRETKSAEHDRVDEFRLLVCIKKRGGAQEKLVSESLIHTDDVVRGVFFRFPRQQHCYQWFVKLAAS